MEFNEYQDILKERLDAEIGGNTEGYENGKSVETSNRCFPRENNPSIEICSTLLIPEKYYTKFLEKRVRHGGVRNLISHLLITYRLHIANGMIPVYRNHTTKYQEKNQNLIKVSFRPLLEDWAELKLYRLSFGLSISAFLVYLLIAESVDFAQNLSHFLAVVGIPLSPNWDLCGKVYLSRKNFHYSTVFQYRKSKYR